MQDELLHRQLSAQAVSGLQEAGHFLHFYAKGRRMRRRTLCLLMERGPLQQKEVQSFLGLQSGSISEMLLKMEKEGLIEKIRCSEDKRSFLLQVTEEGKKQALLMQERYEGRMSRMMDCFTREELEQLCAGLEKMSAHWKSLEEEGFFEQHREECTQ